MDAYDGTEEIEDMPQYQLTFDEVLDKYIEAAPVIEPLENWETQDLIKLMDAVDRELQARGEAAAFADQAFEAHVAGYDEYARYHTGEDDDE